MVAPFLAALYPFFVLAGATTGVEIRLDRQRLSLQLRSERLQCRPMGCADIGDVAFSRLVRDRIQPRGHVLAEKRRKNGGVDAAVSVVFPDCLNPLTPYGECRS